MKRPAPRVRWLLSFLSAVLFGTLIACAGDAVESATVVTPVYGDPCQFQDCSGHGECAPGADGTPECTCDASHGGSDCSGCASGLHLDSADHCVPDRSCADQEQDPCGMYGSCDDRLGVISCRCDQGYEGPRCELCAAGHERNPRGECVATVIVHGNGSTPDTAQPSSPDDGSPPDTAQPSSSDGGSASGQVCGSASCSAHGECSDDGGIIVCACEPGFAGDSCEACAANFHAAAGGACDPSERCQTNSCPEHATCDHSSGLVECSCEDGYVGMRCDGCAPGFYRFFATGKCEQVQCSGGTPPPPATETFDDLAGSPGLTPNVCTTDGNGTLERGDLTLMSTGGEADVYVCGPSTLYMLSTIHVFLDAGSTLPAKLVFARPVAKVSFEHAAISDTVSVDVLADGVVVGAISTHRRDSGIGSYTFAAPITVLAFRSKTAAKTTIAFDNISYEPACP